MRDSALLVRKVLVQIFNLGVANAVSGRTIGLAVVERGALAVSDLDEVLVADIVTVDGKAAAVLPSVPHLQVADPRVAVESALFFLRVEMIEISPAGEVISLRLDTLMREIVEIGAEVSLEHVVTNLHHFAVEELHKVLSTNVENVMTGVVVLVNLHAAGVEEFRDRIFAEEG